MPDIRPAYLQVRFDPVADPAAVIQTPHARFTILTSRLVRMEFSPDGRFEDRPSQAFWYRRQPVPPFQVTREGGWLTVETEYLRLRYQEAVDRFTAETLTICLKQQDTIWHYGDDDGENLLGTTRTLDEVSGATMLEQGLLSRAGWVVVDDSSSLVFNEEGWLEPRQKTVESEEWRVESGLDLYFFGYGSDFKGCLANYFRVAGVVPMLPRWALGNWWSRYWAYTQEELTQLMRDFRAHDVPLSVCIIDMDWHLVNVGEGINGWTGYTWNRELFPDPPGFIRWLHKQGLKTALNLHPALGVRPHEEMYPPMAQRLGIDPASGATIPFDIADPVFTAAYFELLHHPQERNGVDFWWMDWQQGTRSTVAGLDPLWWLNHLHFYDLGRQGKRPFIFSRWGGLGNHRYPIGFSGDTLVTWESLAFQPYFTATAANVGYGWWSHDIGGHMMGVEDAELYARWVQFGAFSPILRLHSTNVRFHERRPWGYDNHTFQVARQAMQLRHALIPYLYTLSWRNHTEPVAPVRPMYHDYPDEEAAYYCPQQYLFGDLVVAPFTSAADPDTRLSRQAVWLPPGDWYHLFSGEYYAGDAWYAIYGGLADIPVFAQAGTILPLGPMVGWGGVENPQALDVHFFAGADGRFVLYEDDGETTAYQENDYCLTVFEQRWCGDSVEIQISPVGGDAQHAPAERRYRLMIYGVGRPSRVLLEIDGVEDEHNFAYDERTEMLRLDDFQLPRAALLRVVVASEEADLLARRKRTAEKVLDMLGAFRLDTMAKKAIAERAAELLDDPAILADYANVLQDSHTRALLEVTQGVGAHQISHTRWPDLLLLWNNRQQSEMQYRFSQMGSGWDMGKRFRSDTGAVPRFQAIVPEEKDWRLDVDYWGQVRVTKERKE